MIDIGDEERLATPEWAYDVMAAEMAQRAVDASRKAFAERRARSERLRVDMTEGPGVDTEFAALFEKFGQHLRGGPRPSAAGSAEVADDEFDALLAAQKSAQERLATFLSDTPAESFDSGAEARFEELHGALERTQQALLDYMKQRS